MTLNTVDKVKMGSVIKLVKGKKNENDGINETRNYIDMKALRTGVSLKKSTGGIAVDEDLVILCDGEYQGYVSIAAKGYLGSTLAKIEHSREFHTKFIYHFLKSNYFLFKNHPRGTGIPHLNPNILKELEIPLYSLKRQSEIVQLLEKAEQQSKNIKSTSDALLQDLSDFRKEILNRAFRGELTEQNLVDGTGAELLQSIQLERQQQEAKAKRKKKTELPPVEAGEKPYDLPENWTWTRLGEVHNFIDYRGRTPQKVGSGVRLVTAKNVKNRSINLEPQEFMREEDYVSYMTRGIPKKGDVLFTTEAPMGQTAMIESEEKIALAQRVILFESTPILNSKYTLYLLLSEDAKKRISKKATGTTVLGIKSANLKLIEFPLAPLAEQRRIVEKIEAIFAQLDIMEDAIRLQKDEASKCYEEILRKSLEGVPELVNEKEERELVSIGSGIGLNLSDLRNAENEE